MAIAELLTQPSKVMPVVPAQAEDLRGVVRVGVHDASRIEWSVTVPLPRVQTLRYSMRLEMQIPSLVTHAPWEQLQSFTRLDGPAITLSRGVDTIDMLRRSALALAAKLSRASDGLTRHCRLAATAISQNTPQDIEETLVIWVSAAERMMGDARARFTAAKESDGAEISRERALVDEYASIRFLEMLAGTERALQALACTAKSRPKLLDAVERVEAHVADALEREIAHRKGVHYIQTADASAPDLERYLERASRLKKHFQEVLFLEAEHFKVADRIHHWVAALAALIASSWAFAWQIALTQRHVSTGSQVGSGIVVLALVAGVIYATKDRMKEMGRTWVSGKVRRVLGAERVARFRAPQKRLPGRDVIVAARESFDQSVVQLPDTLNPESGATVGVTVLRYSHKGEVFPQAVLTESGVRRIKHVFRYDMSPLFARLDDAKKSIPVLDELTHRIRFVDAPRCYRVPIKMVLQCGGVTLEENATLVLHKRGLDRIERDEQDESDERFSGGVRLPRDSDPALLDTELEPG